MELAVIVPNSFLLASDKPPTTIPERLRIRSQSLALTLLPQPPTIL